MKAQIKKIQLFSVTVFILALLFLLFFIIKNNPKQNINSEPQREKLIIGLSQIGYESAWRNRNTEYIFEDAEKNNIQKNLNETQQK